jgi:hypothetical protein
MTRPAVIRGQVLTAEGPAIVAAIVSLTRYSHGTDGKRTQFPVLSGPLQRTNDKGEFRFYDVPPGEYYLQVTGGSMVLGGPLVLYYPGVLDEAKATAVRVSRGEDLQVPTLVWPPREKGTEVKLHVVGAPERPRPSVYIAGAMLFGMGSTANPTEIALRVAPGHHDAVVTINDRANGDLRYALVPLDVGDIDIQREVVPKRAPSITGQFLLENEAGMRTPTPSPTRCMLRSPYGLSNCIGSQVVPGAQEVQLEGLPADAYVLSAKAGDHDILAEGLNVTGDTNLEIVLATPGAIVQGTVHDAKGVTFPGASLALVPDAPYRSTACSIEV